MQPRIVKALLAVLVVGGAVFVWRASTGAVSAGEAGVRDEAEARERAVPNADGPNVQMQAKAFEFLRRFRPDMFSQLDQIKRENPDRYYDLIRRAFEETMELEHLERMAPEAHAERMHVLQVRARAYGLAVQMQKAPESQQAPIRKELVELLGDIFDQRQQELEARLEELTMEREEVRKMVRQYRIEKPRAVEERVQELIGEGEAVQW